MIFSLIQKIIKIKKNATTYQTGLIQAKAYRILKNRTTKLLKNYELSTVEWAILGQLYDIKEDLRPVDIAELLGVERPFITVLLEALEKKDLINSQQDKVDKRTKLICITDKGKKLVPVVEKYLRNEMKVLIKGLSIRDILVYLRVMTTIIENDNGLTN